MERRDLVRLLGLAPVATALDWSPADIRRAALAVAQLRRRGQTYEPKFFTRHEYDTVRLLADLVIPRDERSGSASDAGVPEFMDFLMQDQPSRQTAMRGGLAWLDAECRRRFGNPFLDCSDPQRRALLDDIAWPARAPAELSQGVAFFNSFRDLTASGFWSSKMGIEDLGYVGNTVVPEWTGCPEAQLHKLGVHYDE
jgi:gluconate 2-dehydrogenase gamma chain